MIARRWHGRVPAAKAEAYLELMREVALRDYRGTPGNLQALCLHRREGEIVHVEMLSLWRDAAAVAAFAGEEIERARYYDFDPDFLIEMEPDVLHFVVDAGDHASLEAPVKSSSEAL